MRQISGFGIMALKCVKTNFVLYALQGKNEKLTKSANISFKHVLGLHQTGLAEAGVFRKFM